MSDKVTHIAGIIDVKGTIDNKHQKPKPKHKFYDTLQQNMERKRILQERENQMREQLRA